MSIRANIKCSKCLCDLSGNELMIAEAVKGPKTEWIWQYFTICPKCKMKVRIPSGSIPEAEKERMFKEAFELNDKDRKP